MVTLPVVIESSPVLKLKWQASVLRNLYLSAFFHSMDFLLFRYVTLIIPEMKVWIAYLVIGLLVVGNGPVYPATSRPPRSALRPRQLKDHHYPRSSAIDSMPVVGLEAWFTQIPPVTRTWLALSVLTSVAVVRVRNDKPLLLCGIFSS